MARPAHLAIVGAMLLACPAAQATADPIRLTGSVIISNPFFGATAHLHASHEVVFSDPVLFGEQNNLFGPLGGPGDSFALPEHMSTDDGLGTVAVRGRVYAFGFIGPGMAQLAVRFVPGPVVLPPFGSSGTASAPFEFSGLLEVFDDLPTLYDVTGHGVATLQVVEGSGYWEFGELRYDFAPTPEPAPVGLVLIGAAGIWITARRRAVHGG